MALLSMKGAEIIARSYRTCVDALAPDLRVMRQGDHPDQPDALLAAMAPGAALRDVERGSAVLTDREAVVIRVVNRATAPGTIELLGTAHKHWRGRSRSIPHDPPPSTARTISSRIFR